jgi:hypothetical protein
MTSSARANSNLGTVNPNVLAVVRFTIRRFFVPARLLAFQDVIDIGGRARELVDQVDIIGEKFAVPRDRSRAVYSRQAFACCRCDETLVVSDKQALLGNIR